MTHQHCWVTTDPTGGDPWMGGPVMIVVCAGCGREQMDRPNAYEQGQRDAINAALQRVQALAEPTQWRPLPRKTARISDVIAAIKGG